jgi:Clp protease
VIAMGADPGRLFMEPTAKMMIHDGFAMAAGNAAELSKMVEQLNSASDTIAGVYATRTGKPQAGWREAMKAETWYTAEQAVAEGLADGIVGVTNRAPVLVNHARGDCPSCSARIADVTAKFCGQCGTAIRNADAPKQLGNGWVQDADGSKRFDPDGDGDDDSTAAGDTDHDYFDADGNQVQNIPPCPTEDGGTDTGSDAGDEITGFLVSALRDAAAPHAPMTGTHSHPHPAFGSQGGDATHDHEHAHDGDASHSHGHQAPPADRARPAAAGAAGVDFTPWNVAQAWRDAAAAPDPAAFYAAICAGRRPGDPAVQSSWALPYRYRPGAAPNAEAVAVALERLPATDGLVNTTEATVVLQAAQKVADLVRANGELERASAALAAINQAQAALPDVAGHQDGRPARPSPVAAEDPFAVLLNDGVDNSPWSASKAWHNGASSADPAAFYAGICAGEKSGDKATQAAWALPYRYTPSSPPNAAGVKNALSRLPQTQGLTNAAAAKAKLQGLMKKINPDYEPEDLAELFREMHNTALKEG